MGEGGFFVNEGEHAGDERRRAGLRRAYLFDCNMLSSRGLYGG